MSILNVRKVSSETKRWVDNLRPSLSKRVYDQIIAYVDLYNGDENSDDDDTEESENSDSFTDVVYRKYFNSSTNRTLEKFNVCQTPPEVTSLRLKYPEQLLESNTELVDFFCDYWSTKLEYLELNNYVYGILGLFKTAPIRVLHIGIMDSWPHSHSQFYQVEEISTRWGSSCNRIGPMNNNTNLKRFYIG